MNLKKIEKAIEEIHDKRIELDKKDRELKEFYEVARSNRTVNFSAALEIYLKYFNETIPS